MLNTTQTPSAQASFVAGSLVYDTTDPDRRGKIIRAGIEVSEVRFDDDAERNVPNVHLCTVQTPIGDRLDNPTEEVIRQGQAAWNRLRGNSTFVDWVHVGAAHVLGRATAMRDAHTNKPEGRGYNAAFAAWARKFGFADFDKGDRARLFNMMDNLKEISAWLDKLPPKERLRLNHPSSVWRRWGAATAAPKPDTELKSSPMQKLKDSVAALSEENDRMKREIAYGGGDLWNADDRPKDIARVILGKLSKNKAENVAYEILKALKVEKHDDR
jgi:hypothetical protein